MTVRKLATVRVTGIYLNNEGQPFVVLKVVFHHKDGDESGGTHAILEGGKLEINGLCIDTNDMAEYVHRAESATEHVIDNLIKRSKTS